MYRLLEVGEVIEQGDEIFGASDKWYKVVMCVGAQVCSATKPVRRLVKPAVTPAASSVPDPGEGWRLLTEGETIEPTDEWSYFGNWVKVTVVSPGQKWFASTLVPHRRRVAPVVSVGDRVKVLTGPWAGCTGVVDVPWGKLNQKTCSFDLEAVSVRMDNVFVSGSRLTVIASVSQVERLPPVVPEVLYRDLSRGETVKAGDQYWTFGYGPWADAGPEEIGNTITHYKARHRRPVRLQSPGWRYLDSGETVQAGDEFQWYSNRDIWVDPNRSGNPFQRCGNVVSQEEYFRRKLPMNQGG